MRGISPFPVGKRGRALERRPFSRAACARGPAFLLKNVIISFPFPFNMYVYTFYACVRTHMQCAHSRKPQAVQRAPVARLPGRAPCRWPCSCGRVRFVFAPTVSRGLPCQRAHLPRSRHADSVVSRGTRPRERARRRLCVSLGAGPAGSVCDPGSGAAGLGAPYQPLARLPGSPQRVRVPARVPRARPLFPPSPRPHVSALYRGHLHLNLFTLSMFFDRKSFKFEIVDSSKNKSPG